LLDLGDIVTIVDRIGSSCLGTLVMGNLCCRFDLSKVRCKVDRWTESLCAIHYV